MSEKSEKKTFPPLTLSAEGSHARTSATPGTEPDSTGQDRGFGMSSHESFARWNPSTSSWRTSQLSLLEDSTLYLERWPIAGTMLNGRASRRQTLVPRTSARESSLWPTPHGMSADGEQPYDGHGNELSQAVLVSVGLSTSARSLKRVPTPTARDWKDGTTKSCQNVPVNGLLGRAVHQWPTPVVTDAIGARNKTSFRSQGANSRHHAGTTLTDALVESSDLTLETQPDGRNKVVNGSLNPTWVEWLMGFPLGWTDLQPSETPWSLSAPASSESGY